MNAIIRNGRVLDPASQRDEIADVAIMNDEIVERSCLNGLAHVEEIDATGLCVAPGLIDVHVHLREPGLEYKEDVATGTAAAAAGGFTTVMAMPNTKPAIDSVEVMTAFNATIAENAIVTVLTAPCLTQKRAGKVLVDFEALATCDGVAAFTDDGNCIPDPALMTVAMERCRDLGFVVVDHCEDRDVWNNGVMRAGSVADMLKVPGQPYETETNIVRRNVELSRRTGCKIHMQHVSCLETVRMLREARAEGLNVSAEVCPHHFTLTVDDVPALGVNAKMNPPLGSATDRDALLGALADGTINVICTDHAPHAPHEKAYSLARAPFGIIGLETALPLSLMQLHHSGRTSLLRVVELLTHGPATLLGLDSGTLAIGAKADVVLFDPDADLVYDVNASPSKSRNTPFHGRTLRGRVVRTIHHGKTVFGE